MFSWPVINESHGRGAEVGRGRGVGLGLGVGVDVTVAVGVGVGVGNSAQYLPPVLNPLMPLNPPQMIISLPLQTAVCEFRANGALVMLVAVQLFVTGLYLPPVLKLLAPSVPPQMIISFPVETAV